jgi:hypothetical protein
LGVTELEVAANGLGFRYITSEGKRVLVLTQQDVRVNSNSVVGRMQPYLAIPCIRGNRLAGWPRLNQARQLRTS